MSLSTLYCLLCGPGSYIYVTCLGSCRQAFEVFCFFFFCLFRATPMAHGGSKARGRIGAVATGLCQSHSNTGLSSVCNLHHSSWQRQLLNPLSKARDRTHNLMVPRRIRQPLRHDGSSRDAVFSMCVPQRQQLGWPDLGVTPVLRHTSNEKNF